MENQEEKPPIIQTFADIIRCLDRVPQLKILRNLTPGYIVGTTCTNKGTKEAVRSCFQQLPSEKKWPLGYTVIFMKNHSEIQLRCRHSSKNFKWKFMHSNNFHESEENVHRDEKVFTYGVSTADNAICAMNHLRRIRDIFPAPIDKLMIYNDAIFRKDIAVEISKIGEVNMMHIDGTPSYMETKMMPDAFDVLIKGITVRDQLHVRNISGKEPIVTSKIAQTAFAHLELPTAPAPETLFAAASQKNSFSILKAPKNYCNSLIHCWLKSERCDMDVLRVDIQSLTGRSNNRPFDGLFDGLKFEKGTRVSENVDREKPIIEWANFEVLLRDEGFDIRRKDGATLCLQYLSFGKSARFFLTADYPGRSIRAEKMNEYCDHYAHILQMFYNLNVDNMYRINRHVADWVEQNGALLDAVEKARHDRFQATANVKEILDRTKYWCERALGGVLSEEIRQYFHAAERKTYGYFEKKETIFCGLF